MTTKLVDDYVNFIMDSMSQQIKENEYHKDTPRTVTRTLDFRCPFWYDMINQEN